MKNKTNKNIGSCKLTSCIGPFVKAHILPRALTLISKNGKKIHESSLNSMPRRRPATWYDNQLVIRKGEDILEELDTYAIDQLRETQLIWSGFDSNSLPVPSDMLPIAEGTYMRRVDLSNMDEEKIRLFFLSIVWRVAASNRPEFNNVNLDAQILEDLRQRILTNKAGKYYDYPISFDQITTKGDHHNRAPFLEYSPLSSTTGNSEECLSLRIYFEGLVTRVHFPGNLKITREEKIYLGAGPDLYIIAREYEKTRTKSDLEVIVKDALKKM